MTAELSSRPTARLGSRNLFPEMRASAYLAHAAISPHSLRVKEALTRVTSEYAEGIAAFPKSLERRSLLRGELAGLVGATSGEIALTTGTTRALGDLALCLPWQPGERAVVFEGEFPANVTPWQQACAVFGATVTYLPLGRRDFDVDSFLTSLESELRRGHVRIVAVSAVQFQTGRRMPLREMSELCHRHGARLAVDAIQACGVVPLDVDAQGIDYLACGGHKWLMGAEGAGFLYVRQGFERELVPRTAGWLSHEGGEAFLFRGAGHLRYDRPIAGLKTFEGGTSNLLGFEALAAGISPLVELGVDAIFRHVSTYFDQLEAGLLERGFESLRARDPGGRSAILSVDVPSGSPAAAAGLDAVDVAGRLRERGIMVTQPDGLLRFAPHFPNAQSEVPLVLGAIDEVLAEARP